MQNKIRQRIYTMCCAAVMTALLCVSAQLSIPLGPVPFTLQLLVCLLLPFLLSPCAGGAAMLLYIVFGRTPERFRYAAHTAARCLYALPHCLYIPCRRFLYVYGA